MQNSLLFKINNGKINFVRIRKNKNLVGFPKRTNLQLNFDWRELFLKNF